MEAESMASEPVVDNALIRPIDCARAQVECHFMGRSPDSERVAGCGPERGLWLVSDRCLDAIERYMKAEKSGNSDEAAKALEDLVQAIEGKVEWRHGVTARSSDSLRRRIEKRISQKLRGHFESEIPDLADSVIEKVLQEVLENRIRPKEFGGLVATVINNEVNDFWRRSRTRKTHGMTGIPTVVSDDGTVQTVEDLVAGDSPDPAEVVADIDSIQYYTRLLDAAIEEAHNIIKKNGRFKNADRGRWAFKKRYLDCDDRTSREIVEDPDSPYRHIKSKNKANQLDQDAKRYREQIRKVVATLPAKSRGYLSNLLAVIDQASKEALVQKRARPSTMTPAQAAKEVREREEREREQWAQAHPVRVYTREEIEAFRLSHGKVET